MTFSRRSFAPILSLLPVAALALLTVGCGGDDGVAKYNVPKTTDSGRPAATGGDPHAGMNLPAAGAGNYRILGAMYPAGEPGWAEHISATPVLAWKARDVRMHRGGGPWIWRPTPVPFPPYPH